MDLVLRPRVPPNGDQLDADTQPDMSSLILDEKAQATEANLDSPFFRKFAAEIRLKIYDAILYDEEYTIHMMDSTTYRRLFNREKPGNVHVTAILQTCRQLRNEALPAFHPNVRVKLMHKEGLKEFLKLDTTLLDKSQLQHVIIACRKLHPYHVNQVINQLPKLRTFEVQCLEATYVERFRPQELKSTNLATIFAGEPELRNYATTQLLHFCMHKYREYSFVLIRFRNQFLASGCEVTFKCKVELRVQKETRDETMDGGMITIQPRGRSIEWQLMGRVLATAYNGVCPHGGVRLREPFVWSREW